MVGSTLLNESIGFAQTKSITVAPTATALKSVGGFGTGRFPGETTATAGWLPL